MRHSIYRQVEEIIAREALLLPLFHDQVYCFARPEVEGLGSVSQGNPIVALREPLDPALTAARLAHLRRSGSRIETPMPLSAGTRLGPYEILAPLGAGGMGEVYRARDTRLGRDVAVKVLPETPGETRPDALARFEREARVVAALSHPNILALHDFGQERRRPPTP